MKKTRVSLAHSRFFTCGARRGVLRTRPRASCLRTTRSTPPNLHAIMTDLFGQSAALITAWLVAGWSAVLARTNSLKPTYSLVRRPPKAAETCVPARLRLLTRFAEGLAGNIRVGPIMPIIAAKFSCPSIIGTARALKPIIPSSGTCDHPRLRTRSSSADNARGLVMVFNVIFGRRRDNTFCTNSRGPKAKSDLAKRRAVQHVGRQYIAGPLHD